MAVGAGTGWHPDQAHALNGGDIDPARPPGQGAAGDLDYRHHRLRRRLDSPRVDAATEPYPNRWTHHLLISDPAEIDDELMGWIREAAAFSDGKRKPPAGVVNGALSK